MKNKVLMDLSTIISGIKNPNPVLMLIDLSRLIESIVLYDDIFYYGRSQDFLSEISGSFFEYGLPGNIKDLIKNAPEKIDSNMMYESAPDYLNNKNSPFLLEMLQEVDFRLFSVVSHFEPNIPEENKFRHVQVYALRVYYYMLAATKMKIPYNPQLFRIPIVRYLPISDTNPIPYNIYYQYEEKIKAHIASVTGIDRIEAVFPMLFTFILKEAKKEDPYDIFRVAVELRNSNQISRIRECFGKLTDSLNRFDFKFGSQIK
jgi:hypothetical protein